MNATYVDSSALVAVAFNEVGAAEVADRLRSHDRLYSSNLLEAELRSACAREELVLDSTYLDRMEWLFPDRPLESEMKAVLAAGYLRGADLWHVASALYAFPRAAEVGFFTLGERQRAVAAELGFRV